MSIAGREVDMEKKQIVLEYKAALVALRKAAKSKNKRLAKSAKKILEDRELFAKYLAKRVEDRKKKFAKKNTDPSMWSKCFDFLGK